MKTFRIGPSPFRKSFFYPIKAGYTGRREDSAGRMQCYHDGHHVACADGRSAEPQQPKADEDKPKRKIPQAIERHINEDVLNQILKLGSKVGTDLKKTTTDLVQIGVELKHAEHVAAEYVRDKIADNVAKLPPKLQRFIKGAWAFLRIGTKVAFATYTAGQVAAERVARARGASPEDAAKLRATLSTIDMLTFKPVSVGLGAVAGPAVAVAGSFIPLGSAAYLAYAGTAETWKAASSAIRSVVKRFRKDMPEDAEGLIGTLLDYLSGDNSDYKMALVLAAVDEGLSLPEALDAAREAEREGPPQVQPSPFSGKKTLVAFVKSAELRNPQVGESYFATCERDEGGQCLPSGEAGAGSVDLPSDAGDADTDDQNQDSEYDAWVERSDKRVEARELLDEIIGYLDDDTAEKAVAIATEVGNLNLDHAKEFREAVIGAAVACDKLATDSISNLTKAGATEKELTPLRKLIAKHAVLSDMAENCVNLFDQLSQLWDETETIRDSEPEEPDQLEEPNADDYEDGADDDDFVKDNEAYEESLAVHDKWEGSFEKWEKRVAKADSVVEKESTKLEKLHGKFVDVVDSYRIDLADEIRDVTETVAARVADEDDDDPEPTVDRDVEPPQVGPSPFRERNPQYS